MSWDYSDMSKAAKAVGGPEKYAETLIASGRQQMIPVVILGMGFAGLMVHFGPKIYKVITNKITKSMVTRDEVQEAKETIVKGIKEYDQKQSGEEISDAN